MAGHRTVMAQQREVFGFSVLFCLNPRNYQQFSIKIEFSRGAHATALSGDNATPAFESRLTSARSVP
jgi:hypothetical protein